MSYSLLPAQNSMKKGQHTFTAILSEATSHQMVQYDTGTDERMVKSFLKLLPLQTTAS